MNNNQESTVFVTNNTRPTEPYTQPVYHKPKTFLFLQLRDIQSGADNVLESQGDGFLTS